MGSQLDATMVAQALGDLDAHADLSALSPATVSALRLADVLTGPQPQVTTTFHAELSEHFTADQILELGSALSVASGWQRFIEAFGIRPDSFDG